MKNFVDSVSFEKTERGTKVVMVKSVGRSARNSKGRTQKPVDKFFDIIKDN